jgi:hypothetical protein
VYGGSGADRDGFLQPSSTSTSSAPLQQVMESSLTQTSKPAPTQSSGPTPSGNTGESSTRWRPRGEYKDVTSEMRGKTIVIVGATHLMKQQKATKDDDQA